jgi:hypothetical protein
VKWRHRWERADTRMAKKKASNAGLFHTRKLLAPSCQI